MDKNPEKVIGVRRIEDIESGMSGLVAELSEKKEKAENAANNSVNEIRESFEDAKEKTERRIEELNAKRLDLERQIKSKLTSASAPLKSSVHIFRRNLILIKSEYEKSLIIPIAAFFLVVFVYDPVSAYISPSFPGVNYAAFGIPLIKTTLFILSVLLTWNSYLKIKNSFYVDSNQLEKNIDIMERTDISTEAINISKKKFKDVEPIVKEAKGIFEAFIINLGKSTPVLRQTFDQMTLLAKYSRLIEGIQRALVSYNLHIDGKFYTSLEKNPPAEIQIIDDEQTWENVILEKIADRLKKQNVKVSKKILVLLYSEYKGADTKNAFKNIIESDVEIQTLAKILVDSERLVEPPPDIDLRPIDVVSILRKINDFELSDINSLLNKSIRQLDYLISYAYFLETKNGIISDFKPHIDFVINGCDEKYDFENQVVNLAYMIGKQAFSKVSSLEENLIEGFAKASVSIKFNNDSSLKKYACQISADERTVAVIRAYYDKMKETNRRDTVSLKELLADLTLVQSYLDKTDDIDARILLSQLREGMWHDSYPALLKEIVDKTAEEMKSQFSKIQKYTILQQAVRETFQKVKIDTVEKAIDAQVFGAYVIMFSSEEGELAPLVDKLSIRNLDSQNQEKRWIRKPIKQGEHIYDFIKFSKSTRIGVLDKGVDFIDFKNRFLDDVKKILPENEYYDIGLVVQRINPSKYSFGNLDDENLPSNVNLKNLDIAHYISRLAADHVSPEEQAGVATFERNVNLLDIVKEKSIYELIRYDDDDIKDKEKKILQSDELKKEILNKFDTNFKSLAIDLQNEILSKSKVTSTVKTILKSHFIKASISNYDARADILSRRFTEILGHLAVIYELQQR